MTTMRKYLRTELGMQLFISDKMIRVEEQRDAFLQGQMLTFIIDSLSVPAASVQYPTDWWQSFKKRWFPIWLERRFPVRYEVWTAARYCPHKGVGEVGPHYEFLDTPDVTHLRGVI